MAFLKNINFTYFALILPLKTWKKISKVVAFSTAKISPVCPHSWKLTYLAFFNVSYTCYKSLGQAKGRMIQKPHNKAKSFLKSPHSNSYTIAVWQDFFLTFNLRLNKSAKRDIFRVKKVQIWRFHKDFGPIWLFDWLPLYSFMQCESPNFSKMFAKVVNRRIWRLCSGWLVDW